MNRAALGIAIGVGDRGDSYKAAQEVYAQYKTTLSKYMNWIATSPNAMRRGRHVVIVNGNGVIDENMTGAVSSLVSSSNLFGDKVTIVTTVPPLERQKSPRGRQNGFAGKEGTSARICRPQQPSTGGGGGGTPTRAGREIPKSEWDGFC